MIMMALRRMPDRFATMVTAVTVTTADTSDTTATHRAGTEVELNLLGPPDRVIKLAVARFTNPANHVRKGRCSSVF